MLLPVPLVGSALQDKCWEHGAFPCKALVLPALQAGSRGISCHACPVSSTHQDAELGSTLLAPPWRLRGHSDNHINFLIMVAPVPVSGNPQGLSWAAKVRRKSLTVQLWAVSSLPAPACFWSPEPLSPETFTSIWHMPPEGAASLGSSPPNPPQAGIPQSQPSCDMCQKGLRLQKNPLARSDCESGSFFFFNNVPLVQML